MKIVPLPDAPPRERRIAIGTFDGVHLGHRAVIADSDSVLTFEPHPLAVLAPEALPKLLTPLATKAGLIETLGVEELVVVPFDREMAALDAQAFVDRVLVEALGAREVSVGQNFRFGRRAGGDADLLAADDRFETRVAPLVEVEGETVSSSHIRGLVHAGDVERAAVFLGAPFTMRGQVTHGDERGRKLGFPTANLVPDDTLAHPGHGIYAGRVSVGDDPTVHAAAVNVGVRPTFGTGRALLVEAYLLDFDADLYDRDLRVEFLTRLRGERAFASFDALVEQMGADVARTRALWTA